MDFMRDIIDFQNELGSVARELKRQNIKPSSYDASDNTEISGWEVEYTDSPYIEDINPNRTPIYLGASWGDERIVLGEDGVLYAVTFRGEDVYEGGQIVTRTSTKISRVDLSWYVQDQRDPFKDIRGKVRAAAMRAVLQKSS